ncbi:MAG: hypothetical protein VX278_02270 [Myxococcota bacterium]|nr:hypothetical protein [Myxococcota bacterium]
MILLVFLACLERVTGIPTPLDPRFFASNKGSAASNDGGSQEDATPFASVAGDKILLSGVVTSKSRYPVDIDFRIPDESVEGGMSGQGKLLLKEPGAFSLSVPENLGDLEIQVFQDLKSDGPSEDDFFAQVTISIAADDVSDLKIELIEGGVSSGVQSQGPRPFGSFSGEKITLSGLITSKRKSPVDIDFRIPDESAEGGMSGQGKLLLKEPGAFSLSVPKSLGDLEIQAFQDLTADGPSKDDFFAQVSVAVGAENVSDLEIELIEGGVAIGEQAKGPTPFASFSGEKVTLSGVIRSKSSGIVDIDFRVPDDSVEGGMAGQGKILLQEPGEFSLSVPKDLGDLEIQAFQDLTSDGPSVDDPFAQVNITIAADDILDISMELEKAARGSHQVVEHKVVPHNDFSSPKEIDGDAVAENLSNPDPFGGQEGSRVTLSGVLKCDDCPLIDLDLFQPDENAPGGRTMLGKLKLPPGSYSIDVPRNFGDLILEAFVDYEADGPGAGDRMGSYINNPVKISSSNLSDINIELIVPEDGRMPMGAQPP